jgi:hypothetical protein
MPLASKPDCQPLPENQFALGTNHHMAYEECRLLEQKEAWLERDLSENIMRDMPPSMVARVLGYALMFAPSEAGRDFLARDILSCRPEHLSTQDASYCSPELLAGLAHIYVFGVIHVCESIHYSLGPEFNACSLQS